MFTTSILEGQADEILPSLFDERIRREEGRPVTLGELLSAFKDAAEDAEELKIREENRLAHQAELGEYLNNVGGRMHNEDSKEIFIDAGMHCAIPVKTSVEKSQSNRRHE